LQASLTGFGGVSRHHILTSPAPRLGIGLENMKFIYKVDGFEFRYKTPAIEWLVTSKGLDDSPVSRSVDFAYFKALLHFLEKEAEKKGSSKDPGTGVIVELRK
jgi:hypothetical protein